MRGGLIKESDSPLSLSPIMLVRKTTIDLCFCVHYGQLNDITKKGCFPLPRTDDTLDILAGAKQFPTLDLKSDY
jgi:hypothetical protein